MGKAAARLWDIGSGHGGYPPTPVTSGSGDVTTNGRPAARVGDSLLLHAKPKSPPHGRSIAQGSSTVSINGRAAARVGDNISCGGSISTGSGNVTIGDTITLTPPDDARLPDIVFDRKGKIQTVVEREQKAKQRQVIEETSDISQKPVVKKRFSFSLSS